MLDWLFGRTSQKGKFSFGEKEYLTPSQLGVALVKISLDSTADTVRRMTQLPITHELKFYIDQNPRAAQLQLILCELAASYTYCTMLNGINTTILDAILDGFREGLRIMHKGAPKAQLTQ